MGKIVAAGVDDLVENIKDTTKNMKSSVKKIDCKKIKRRKINATIRGDVSESIQNFMEKASKKHKVKI